MDIKKEKCSICGKYVERKKVTRHDDHEKVVLTCDHNYRLLKREPMASVPVSESIRTNVISFDNKQDRTRGIGALTRSKVVSSSIEGDKFIVKKEHLQLFKQQGIKFKVIE